MSRHVPAPAETQPSFAPQTTEQTQHAGFDQAMPHTSGAIFDGAGMNNAKHGGLSTAQRSVLHMQRTQGNSAVRRMLASQAQPDSIQRTPESTVQREDAPAAASTSGGAGKFPFEFSREFASDKKLLKYFKLTKYGFKVKGGVQTAAPKTPADTTGDTTTVTPMGGGESVATDTKGKTTSGATVSGGVENKHQLMSPEEATKAVEGFFDSEIFSDTVKSIEPYGKATGSAKVGTKEQSGKIAYELGVDAKFAHDLKMSAGMEFVLWEGKSKISSPDDLKTSSSSGGLQVKLSGGKKFKDKPAAGMETEAGLEGFATFEPDWQALFMDAVKGIAENPEVWILAAMAAGLVVAIVDYGHQGEREKFANKSANIANGLVKASTVYAAMITGDKVGAYSVFERKAAEQATADLPKTLQKYGAEFTPDAYFEALRLMPAWKAMAYGKAKADFRMEALTKHRQKMEAEVDAWHAEHGVKSFFLGGADGDKRIVEENINHADRTDGDPTMG
jgi:hypothetical protein